MAVPKRRTSRTVKNQRRASSYKLPKTTLSTCPQCKEIKLPHRVCKSCGYYGNREAISVE